MAFPMLRRGIIVVLVLYCLQQNEVSAKPLRNISPQQIYPVRLSKTPSLPLIPSTNVKLIEILNNVKRRKDRKVPEDDTEIFLKMTHNNLQNGKHNGKAAGIPMETRELSPPKHLIKTSEPMKLAKLPMPSRRLMDLKLLKSREIFRFSAAVKPSNPSSFKLQMFSETSANLNIPTSRRLFRVSSAVNPHLQRPLRPTTPSLSTNCSSKECSGANSAKFRPKDALEEFCKVACKVAMAGPECDCPGHAIG